MPAARPRSLGQAAGVMGKVRQADNDTGKQLKKRIAAEPTTHGQTKVYLAAADGAPIREPDVNLRVPMTVEEALDLAAKYAIPALDAVATVDATNMTATADLIVRGKVLVEKVPAAYLLFLRNYLAEWKGFIDVLPVQKATRVWHSDPTRKGLFRGEVEVTGRYDKRHAALQLTAATDKHAPTATPIVEEYRVGEYHSTLFTGAVTEERKRQLLDACDELINAVSDAIARTHHAQVTEFPVGEQLLTVLLARA